jgi:hypothetical protein
MLRRKISCSGHVPEIYLEDAESKIVPADNIGAYGMVYIQCHPFFPGAAWW